MLAELPTPHKCKWKINFGLGCNRKTDDELVPEVLDFLVTIGRENNYKRSVGQHFTLMLSVWGDDDDEAYIEIKASDFDAIKRKKEQGLLLKT